MSSDSRDVRSSNRAPFDVSTFVGAMKAGERSFFLDLLQRREFRVGQSVFLEGGTDSRIAVVLSGRVKLEAHASSGRRVLLGLRGPGDLLGELRAIDGLGRAAQVLPLETVVAGLMPISKFRELVDARPSMAQALLGVLARRLREADRGRLQLGTSDALGRVSGCLVSLARLYGIDRGDHVELLSPLNQDELGSWAGLSRQATARVLRQLRDEHLVSSRGPRFQLHDVAALATLAGL